MHILAAGCTDFSTCAPVVYMLFNILLPLYKEEHRHKLLGEQFWLTMYMAGAQCKTLILNTKACIPLESSFASADFRVANAEKGAQTT